MTNPSDQAQPSHSSNDSAIKQLEIKAAMKRTFLKALIVLSIVVLIGWAVMAAFVWQRSQMAGLISATLAAVVCWGASVAALGLTYKTAGTADALSGVLGGVMLRTGVPMGFGLLGTQGVPLLAEAGFMGMMLLMFLLTLAVETYMAVGIVTASKGLASDSKAAAQPQNQTVATGR